MKVLVLSGGDSPEREVSLRSGKAIVTALVDSGYEVAVYDPKEGIEGLKDKVNLADVVFPILHGKNGEDGVIQLELEKLNAKFLGSNSEVSKNAFDKEITHDILSKFDIRMPKFSVVTETDLSNNMFNSPFVLKPLDGGSSVDTLIAREVNQAVLQNASDLIKKHNRMLLEELIIGQEITVPVLGNEALPVIVIIPPKNGEFDYENKYNGESEEICPAPVSLISLDKQIEAQELSVRVHEILGARHISRTDIIMKEDGELVVLELNTIPGMTGQSLFPNSANVAGYSMLELVDKFVKMVSEE